MSRRNTVEEKDRGYKALVKRIDEAKGSYVDSGWWGPKHHGDQGEATTAYIASIHEYGAPRAKIPERPFLRPAQANGASRYRAWMRKGAALIVEGKATVRGILAGLGERMTGDIQRAITLVRFPPLSDRTLARRKHGGDKPLIDTGWMRASCGYRVIVQNKQVSEVGGG